MLRARKIRLYPSEEQINQFYDYIGASRFVWNYFLEVQNDLYNNGLKYMSAALMGKKLVELKGTAEYSWLKNIAHHTLIGSIRNLDFAYQQFFKKVCGVPKFKSRKTSKLSFYTRSERLSIKTDAVKLDSYSLINARVPDDLKGFSGKIHNARVVFENNKWILIISLDCESQAIENTDKKLGIDVGIANYMTVFSSDNTTMIIDNVNNTDRIKNLESKKRYLQSKLSCISKRNGYIKSRRYLYYQNLLKNVYYSITNIRKDYMYQVINKVFNMYKPCEICIESLDVIGMRDIVSLRSSLEKVALGKLLQTIERKADEKGIKVIKANKNYASTQICSVCGVRNKDILLSDRVYNCPVCFSTINRDVNAAINLLHYTDLIRQ